ncbi:MAG: hypothetical protein WEC99_10120 [Halofilum sp. (in: g-proteobacteria)]
MALRPFCVLLLGLLAAGAVSAAPETAATEVGEVRAMARAGAPGLALSLLEDAQPQAAEDPDGWARWERARITILARNGGYRRALERLDQLPAGVSGGFARWTLERRAVFHLELGEAASAGRLLRTLLWAQRDASEEDIEAWRRLVIRAHLVADRVGDAVVALRRFDQDYDDGSAEWAALRTRVLLRAERAGEAAARLPAEPEGEVAALATLAQARAGRLGYTETYRRSAEAAQAEGNSAENAARWWFVAADAALRHDDRGRRALALERALDHVQALPAGDTLFAVDGTDLWDAWLAFGRRVGNDEQLLIGDDDAWFAAAESGMPQSPVRARALLAVIAQQGGAEARERAHRALLDQLEEHGPGLPVARRAYLDAPRYFADTAAVPDVVRYRLVDDALAAGDLELASRLLSSLSSAPPGVEPFSWSLMRARVLVRGERYGEGAGAVAEIIAAQPGLNGERLDRLLQVIFDLQGAGEHQRSLALLERAMHPELPVQRRRELLYWQAESYEGLEQYRRSAEVYMRSALLTTDPEHIPGADPWGQTARYQAAGMLARAGLVGDARRIYQDLLRTTQDSERRSTLRHRLRQLPTEGEAPHDLAARAGANTP